MRQCRATLGRHRTKAGSLSVQIRAVETAIERTQGLRLFDLAGQLMLEWDAESGLDYTIQWSINSVAQTLGGARSIIEFRSK